MIFVTYMRYSLTHRKESDRSLPSRPQGSPIDRSGIRGPSNDVNTNIELNYSPTTENISTRSEHIVQNSPPLRPYRSRSPKIQSRHRLPSHTSPYYPRRRRRTPRRVSGRRFPHERKQRTPVLDHPHIYENEDRRRLREERSQSW